ncbi:MAG: phosphoribosylanthranilate isomerase [Desulfobacterota bacterium]|nr:phosphoribosylanthranilate isomerase [Thermodesulfobacteriota bacterium]
MVKVKICGITNLEDALLACKLGADAIGFVFYKKSKRYIEPSSAKKIIDRLPPFVTTVGVFVEEDEKEILTIMREINLDRVQIYRDLKLDKRIAIRVIRIRDENDISHIESTPYFPLLDSYTEAYGGEGVRFDWSMLKGVKREFILAGGINLDNIDLALELKPYGIDISSGVEERPGKKSAKKMEELIRRIRCYG